MKMDEHRREQSALDMLLAELDYGLRSLWGAPGRSDRPGPADGEAADRLTDRQARLSAALMRVNLAGELSAQGLYRGQALVAGSERTKEHMLHAAEEEREHLTWCRRRIAELGGAPSLFNPLWYAGSVLLGAAVGLAGDRWSYGFVAETERQVAEHLTEHLERLPPEDPKSRAILEQMRSDEQRHGQDAVEAGAALLPPFVRTLMRRTAKVMTRTAFRI